MKKISVLLIVILFYSCKTDFVMVSRKDVALDSISTRAIMPMNGGVWFGGTNSKAGFVSFDNPSDTKIVQLQKEKTDFRSIGADGNIYFLNAGSPANLYEMRMFNTNYEAKIIYNETGEKVFYDSVYITGGGEGVIIGDPTENCLSILIRENLNKPWRKIPCDSLPKTAEGEAAFAASDTNVKILGEKSIYIISGGMKSRFFRSEDFGKTWEVFDLPITQGTAMSGAFSMDFYDKNKGIVVGGNYDKQNDNSANKATTKDGGKTWQLVAENQSFGYASCVQYAPNAKGKIIFSCGTGGVFYSNNHGKKWTKFLEDKDFYTVRFSGNNTLILGGKNKVTKVVFAKKK